MSRPESVASGGFFALPPPLVPLVAGLLVPGRTGYAWALVDLCMGAGDAIAGIAHRLFGDLAKTSKVHVYGVEMEAGRYQLAKRWKASFKPAGRFELAHGDAFRLRAPRLDRYGNVSRGASVILLNPPYENGTMEARFLAHSLSFFGWEGVLVYVVPASALAKSAPILAQHFTQVHCYRFPDPHYAAFGQVVLVAQKRTPLLAPDAVLEATLREWASRPETIPVLTTRTRQVIEIPSFGHAGFEEWVVQPTDATALLAKVRPWHMTTRAGESKPIPGIMPERAGEDLMRKVYPLASIPRPAFVSAALAADIYSGKMIHPADPKSGLPALLIKGVFDKADIEMDEKVDKEGVVKGKIKIEQPRLAVTVLDLATHAYHTLKNSVEVTGSTDLATMTMGDLLENYGPALLEAMFEACPILHDTRREDHHLPMPELGRPLLQAQAHAVMTCIKLLGGAGLSITARRGLGAFLYGQIGVGKTQVALATMRALGSRRPLVMCPPNILRSWQDQIGIVTPEARVRWVDSIAAVDAFAVDKGLPGEQIGILSREAAKLGSAWQGIGSTAIVPPTDWAEGTETGSPWLNEPLRPALAVRLAVTHLGPVAPLVKGEDPGTAELYCAVETSDDGHAWRLLDVFPAVRARGETTLALTKAGRWLRLAWTATGDVSFGVEPIEAIRRPFCPRCGAPVVEDPDTLARLRITCKARPRHPMEIPVGEDGPTRRCPIARMAEELARALLPVAPDSPEVGQLLTGRHEARIVAHLSDKAERHRAALGRQGHHGSDRDEILHAEAQARWEGRKSYAMLRPLLAGILATRMAWEDLPHDKGLYATKQALTQAILSLVAAVDDPDWIAREAVDLYLRTKNGEEQRDADLTMREIVRQMLLLLPPGCDAQRRAEIQCKAAQCEEDRGSWRGSWLLFRQKRDALLRETTPPSEQPHRREGMLVWGKQPVGSFEHALTALATFTDLARWETTDPCGEQLYQTVPIPRRYPVAKYIARRHPGLFDFFLLDEAHQYASGSSAQSFAARRLIWTGMPSLLLTGTAMGGYAEQLFMMQWAIDREFREEFDQDDVRRFVEIYGFLKKLEEDRDPTTKAVVAYGSMTDRVERTTRVIGSAPGVLPLFLLKYMLRKACILHRSDFDFELPGVEEIAVPVYADAEHQKRYEELKDALKAQIKKDKRDPDKRGKLMGQVTRLPAYLDMATADCGNGEGGAFEITYPPEPAPKVRLIRGMKRPPKPRGELVARQDPFPVSYRPAKERELLKIVRAELAEGRPAVVFATNTPVLARLHRVLSEELGEPVAFLQANKVSAVDRQDWIDEQVIAKKIRMLVVNAVCVGVGLNNLVYFPTAIWFENPMCDAVIRRQADGRFDRLGKTLITRIYSLFYEDTVQEQLHKLLLHKVGVSMATDGLDASGALAAAGVGEQDRFSDLAIATVIVSMINGEYKSPKMSKAAVTLGAVLRV